VKTLVQGSGAVVRPDSYVIFNVEGKVWTGSRPVVDSFTDRTPHVVTAIP
jgi:hypothetical protein